MHALVGTVTTRKGARLHLAVHGLAYCGAGTGRILGPARELTAGDAAVVCRRCSRRLAAIVAQEIEVAARRRDAGAARRLARLDRIADLLRTPEQAAADAAMAAGIRRVLTMPTMPPAVLKVPAPADQPALFAA